MFGLQKETVFYVSVAIRNTCLDLVCGLQCHSPCLYPSLPVCYGQYRHARRISDSEGKNQKYFPNENCPDVFLSNFREKMYSLSGNQEKVKLELFLLFLF